MSVRSVVKMADCSELDWPPVSRPVRLLVFALAAAWPITALGAQLIKHLPMHDAQDRVLYAKVQMADGSPVVGFPVVEAVCGGVAYPLGFADTQGNFHFTIASGGDRFNPIANSEGDALDLSFLAGCQFRAHSPGFESQHVSPSWLREMKDANTISVGTIQLSRSGQLQSDTYADPLPPKPAKDAYRKGGAALANAKWAEAKSDFEKAVSLQPAYFFAWIGMGLANEGLEQWHEAESAYQEARRLRPKSPDPCLRVAVLGTKRGNWEQAAQYSEAAIGLDPHHLVEGYSLCALANAKLKRMDVAESSARAGLKLEGANDYPELWLSLAVSQAAGKDYAGAGGSLRQYLKLVPKADSVPEIKKELGDLRTLLSK